METKSFRDKYNGKSGIYLITPTWLFNPRQSDEKTFLVKIGESTYTDTKQSGLSMTGLAYRLDQYLFCFVEGFYVWGVFTTDARQSKNLEASVHSYLRGKKRDFETVSEKQHSRSSEWFYLSKVDLNNLLMLLTNDSDMKEIIQEAYTHTTLIEINDKISTRVALPMSTPQRQRIDRENEITFHTNERHKSLSRTLF